ncbi:MULTISPECIES: enoyl-CoA hydratase [Neobacillus]|uniref:Enoyl-CoA hydratase n=1 Tax=Neobacillus rhizophilus TaxID=2833579 RepID=A0A942U3F2_9BACI|nr:MULTISPECIES: enoyl-CoA hydratase [Neobacillus]MBS4210874.1 enoyl-CoA hydratase [Neobacillus rhizophilus]
MDFETIVYKESPDEGIAWVTMNRPQKRNAINKKMILEMGEAFRQAEKNDDIRVIIFNGEGPCFSAGHDLSAEEQYPSTSEERIIWERKYYFDEIMYLRNIRKPLISQVHSYCIAAGLVLALMADIVIVSEDAVFNDPVVRMGANSQEVMILPWVVGEKKAKELLFTGDSLTAHEAFRLGMINQVVPREELDTAVYEMAKKVALMPPMAVSLVKESINNTLDNMGFTNSMKMHFASHLLSHSTEEARNGMGNHKRGDLKKYFDERDKSFKSSI